MASPSSKKRCAKRSDDGNETSSNNNIIAESPRKIARNSIEGATPKNPTRAPRRSNNNAAVIPPTGEQPEDEYRSSNAAISLTPQGRKNKAAKPSPSRALDNPRARRAIFPHAAGETDPLPVTPSHTTSRSKSMAATITPPKEAAALKPPAKRRLIFGREVEEIISLSTTKRVYKLVKKLTGSIGGNGSCGPIYGELTMGSMQKMVNLMQQHTRLNSTSRFIDVGSGIGKPNLHVAQDPGVAFSCGIEMELDRWRLGLKCLQFVLQESSKDATDSTMSPEEKIRHNCMFLHGNIMEAHTFDPFTHVYMFSIGFPPTLWVYLAEAWNRSRSPYMICYHNPKTMIDDYEFDLVLLAQIPTSMHGSKEGHTGYIYQRKGLTVEDVHSYIQDSPCDPVFEESYKLVQTGCGCLRQAVNKKVEENWASRRSTTRSVARKNGVILSKSPEAK